MTLLDLCKLLKKSLALVIALPVACALIAGAVVLVSPAEYSATATITASSEPAGVGAFATEEAERFSQNGTEITATTNTSTRTITLKAEGGSAEQAMGLVNKAANSAFLRAYDRYNPYTEAEKVPSLTMTLTVKFAESATDISPSAAKTAGIALVAGLFAAICIVVIRDMMRGGMHSARDLEEDYELQLLGRIGAGDDDALAREQLLANVRFASGEHKSVCAVAVDDGALAAQACLELARAAAQADRSVLVVDADMHGSSALAAELQTGAREGLAEVLAGKAQLADAVYSAQGMDVLAAGQADGAAAALLGEPELARVLEQAASRYDLVLMAATPSEQHADFSYLANAAGSTVLCVREFATKRNGIEAALSQLIIAKANVIGFIAAS